MEGPIRRLQFCRTNSAWTPLQYTASLSWSLLVNLAGSAVAAVSYEGHRRTSRQGQRSKVM